MTTLATSRIHLPARASATLVVAGLVAPLAAVQGIRGTAAVLGIALVVAIAVRPVLGVAMVLFFGPLIVGVARGDLGIVLRPNEALLLAAAAGTALHCAWAVLVRRVSPWPALQPLDVAMLLLTATGAVLPVLIRYGRGLELVGDDLLYAAVFVKYLVLYATVRIAARTPEDVGLLLRLVLASGAVVGILSILQVLDLFGVPEFLHAWYDNPYASDIGPVTSRGTSTIASSFGTGDVMLMCLALTLAWIVRMGRVTPLAAAAAALFVAACFSAGSFSGVIGALVAVLAVGLVTGRLARFGLLMLPAGLAAAALAWPAVAGRLAGFESRFGLPSSWIGRLQNLERYVWPELATFPNWLVGVRPAARIPAPEAWREWVFIESGHLWLLWTGGVPLMLAFLLLMGTAARDLWQIGRSDTGPVGIAAIGGFAGTAAIFVLMTLDPHLTVRGAADLYFPLLALALVPLAARRAGWPTAS
ncbi:MAG: hypothetical protein U1E14_16045 [Geminicoccaceae bacterium]